MDKNNFQFQALPDSRRHLAVGSERQSAMKVFDHGWVEVYFWELQKPTCPFSGRSYVEGIPGVKILQMGIGKAPSIGAADTDVTSVKKNVDIWQTTCPYPFVSVV